MDKKHRTTIARSDEKVVMGMVNNKRGERMKPKWERKPTKEERLAAG